MEGMEPGFLAQGIFTGDEFRGSMLDLLQAYFGAAWVSRVGNSNVVY